MALKRMDNVGIVVEDLEATIALFVELGLELEGQMRVEGSWADRVVGLNGMQVDIAMLRTPDGHSRLELSRFIKPEVIKPELRNAPVNTLGYSRVMFAVENIEDVLARLKTHGVQLVDQVQRYEDSYLLCYVRSPEGFIIALAEELK
ncbi:VOC family protein [Leptospira kmetyi]|uniref:VOC family protein n=1 Tax=Leptospira kmetyi TaxID=408139 RepID=A0A2M9XWF4_9LEPT|nr:VOC family protein [Leptospira kmetyi]AYV56856.1 VOC family protein [Leptospira kmetyi]EQA51986.1 glyoxalase-like domain protein [Leptospira kmetyi serovar Malaysia str. Bejo-Iso9]PJZ31149.1 VOC family protein [Leptospira kmetyi]PJZ43476.1 VOC family protein [Leptospira kmetyi]TGK21772.1 VOC family protein [Leptospira kmetyi]